MSTAIVYASTHNGNTRKLVEAIKAVDNDVKLIDVMESKVADLDEYEVIGVASGIYAGKFNKDLMGYLKDKLPRDKRVFTIYTYAMKIGHYANEIKALVEEKHSRFVGEYSCQGHNTFGPFKLIGGTAKGHPKDEEVQGAVEFYRTLPI